MANAISGLTSDTKRVLDIVKTISRHKVGQGMTPEKAVEIFKDLGPTYVKLGQILSMHPEIIPPEYCKALECLRADGKMLVAAQIRDIISEEYGKPWNKVFKQIMPIPVGSASIAQVHEAYLHDGTHVAIKVQRPDIYDTMERDVAILKKALSIVNTKFAGVVDLPDAIEQMWLVAKEEMDFIREAENIKTVRKNTENISYIYCPKVYDELTTKNVLVMEYIGGYDINDKEHLLADGYNIKEICTKFINNFIKQFAEDRFFHADPHPGNVRVQDGQIVWLDLGMMGYLTQKDADLVTVCMKSIFTNDYVGFANAVLNICEHDPNIDMDKFYAAMKAYLNKYRVISMEDMIDTVDIFKDLFNISREFKIKVPGSMTMFWRSMGVMEGTVADLAPDTDLVAIIGKHLAAQAFGNTLAGSVLKGVTHRKLISGKPLSYNGHVQDDDDIELADQSDKDLDEIIRRELGGAD